MEPKVSVIVCTIGRETLTRALNSLAFDKERIDELVIVDDSKNGIECSSPSGLNEVWIKTNGMEGIAHARREGVRNASNSWVAFLDDDDVWLSGKLNKQFAEIQRYGLDFSLTSALTFSNNSGKSKMRPARALDLGVEPFSILYSKPHLFYSQAFLPTSSFLLRKSIAIDVLDLYTPNERENLIILQRSFEEGARIRQSTFAGVGIFENRKQSLDRISVDTELSWLFELDRRSKLYGDNFRFESVRNFMRAKKFGGAAEFFFLSREHRESLDKL